MQTEETIQNHNWRWIGISAVITLFMMAMTIALISSGLFDPKPQGKLIESTELFQVHTVTSSEQIEWIDNIIEPSNYTIRLTAKWASGEQDVGYGLILGSEDEHLIVAVSPLGYTSMWAISDNNHNVRSVNDIFPWQTWPHIRYDDGINEIWVDIQAGALTAVRINRELLWQGNIPLNGNKYGLWSESFADPATVDFLKTELFVE